MKKNVLLQFIIVALLASMLRLYQLGLVPHGLFWDEAAVAYNGWSIMTTHRDEWLYRMPVSFKSFGDFKAPLAIYANGISTALFGLEPWAVRLPYAFFSILSVLVFFALGLLMVVKKIMSQSSVFYGSLLLAVLPWHVHYARIGYENNIALFFILLAGLSLAVGYELPKYWKSIWSKPVSVGSMLVAGAAVSCSMYASHSAKIFIPIFGVLMLVFTWRTLLQKLRLTLSFIIAMAIPMIPLLLDTVQGEGATRSNVILSFSWDKPWDFFAAVIRNVVVHLDPNYLFFGLTGSLRHGDGAFGILLPGMAILLLIGIVSSSYAIIFRKTQSTEQKNQLFYLALICVIAGMLPGWITEGAPHSSRTFLAIPGIIIWSMLGWDFLLVHLRQTQLRRQQWAQIVLSVVILIDVLWICAYLKHYYQTYAVRSEADFQAGYAEVFAYLQQRKVEGTLPSTIVFSKQYGQPYIYALLYEQLNPISYHQGGLNRYLFVDAVSISDISRKDALVVGTITDQLPIQPTATILSQSGAPRFYVYNSQAE